MWQRRIKSKDEIKIGNLAGREMGRKSWIMSGLSAITRILKSGSRKRLCVRVMR